MTSEKKEAEIALNPNYPVYLITGAGGFIGTWVICKLLSGKKTVASNIITTDVKKNEGIWEQVLPISDIAILSQRSTYLNITDYDAFYALLERFRPNRIIHLAGLQVPTCRARPILGATVNVIGTLTVFEAIKQFNSKYSKNDSKDQKAIECVVYASSAGVCGPKEDYLPSADVSDADTHVPRTHYGVFKLCNEGNARIYWQDHQIASIGLRPLTVFGVGRELGVTSDATKAIKACVLGQKYVMRYKGTTLFHYVEDIAELFIDCCDVLKYKPGAYHCNIKGSTMSVEGFLKILFGKCPQGEKLISVSDKAFVLPFPDAMKQETLDGIFNFDGDKNDGKSQIKGLKGTTVTPVMDAIYRSVEMFEKLKKEGRLHDRDLKTDS